MAKDKIIVLRVDADAKRRIANAARLTGRSITDFVLENMMKVATKVERSNSGGPKGLRGPYPSFFKACCATATAGGTSSYRSAAVELTRHLRRLRPWELKEELWAARMERLDDLLDSGDTDEQISDWFDANLPRCMARVPKRRRRSFVAGVRLYFEHRGLDLD